MPPNQRNPEAYTPSNGGAAPVYQGGGLSLGGYQAAYGGASVTGGSAIGATAYTGTPMVFWGAQTKGEAFHDYQNSGHLKTLDEAMTEFNVMPEVEQKAIANKLYRAGMLEDPNDLYGAYDQWKQAVNFAAQQYTFGHKRITPFDVLQTRIGVGERKQRKAETRTTTSTAAQVLSNGDADAMVKAIYQQQLGRDPSKGELSRYRSMLINKVKDSPQTTKTTTHYDADGNAVSSNSIQSGGLDAQGQANYLSTNAQADPEWGAYQAATKYFNLVSSALSAPGGA